MISRRTILTSAVAFLLAGGAVRAQGTDKATAFVKATGEKLVAVVNGPGSADAKRAEMTRILNTAVDVDGIARFCLGRFWRTATPEQQQQYIQLFHEVLVTNVTGKLGEYQGVTFAMGRSKLQDDEAVVSTVVNRPNNPPTAVDWVIADPSGNPKIIDVVAEGTSLRLTQRQDYASYLSHNSGKVEALIMAMRRQIANLAD